MPNLSTLVTNTIPPSSVSPSKLTQPLTYSVAKSFNWNGLTTNTFLDFEDVPHWARKITIIFDGVTANSNSQRIIRLGTSEGYVSTGYSSYWGFFTAGNSTNTTSSTTGFGVWSSNEPDIIFGHMLITRLTPTSTRWISSNVIGYTQSTQGFTALGGGGVNISGTVDRIRVTSANGTDRFDNGTISIIYEG